MVGRFFLNRFIYLFILGRMQSSLLCRLFSPQCLGIAISLEANLSAFADDSLSLKFLQKVLILVLNNFPLFTLK